MDRRDFLKTTAMTAAAAAAARLAFDGGPVRALPRVTDDGVSWDKAPCRFCGTGCHVQVGTKGGKVVAIAGDQQAEVNKGLLCVKGYHVGLALYGKDRLTRPLLRKDGKLVPITWEQALDIVADKILANPAGFAIYGSGQWTIPEGYAAQKLIKAGLATNQIDPNARLCMASAVTGFLSTYGVDEPAGCYDDLDHADVVLCWGNNPAEMHPVLFSRFIDRKSRGEKITLIDLTTRRTRTSGFADRTILFKPQGDLAIANGIAHLLLERGTWDQDFVAKYCNFRKRTDPPTLDGQVIDGRRVPRGAGRVHAGARRGAGRGVAGRPRLPRRSVRAARAQDHQPVVHGHEPAHARHGDQRSGARHPPAVGALRQARRRATSLTGQPSACGTVREVGTLAHGLPGGLVVAKPEHRKEAEEHWNLPEGRINPKPGYHTVEMWKRFSTPKDKGGDIDTIWVQVTNPARSLPNVDALFYPSRKIPGKFLIVSDVYPTATAMAADLVLPSAMWVEKNGMVGNSERRTQQWFKQVPPPGEARDDCWQTIAVARRLHDRGHPGLKDKDGKFLFHVVDAAGKDVPVWDWERYYDVNVDEQLFEEYRKFSRHKHKDLAPYSEYVKARGLRWPVVEQADGTPGARPGSASRSSTTRTPPRPTSSSTTRSPRTTAR
jgi:nitrate reductase NapA